LNHIWPQLDHVENRPKNFPRYLTFSYTNLMGKNGR
jgi:hypothetical protein